MGCLVKFYTVQRDSSEGACKIADWYGAEATTFMRHRDTIYIDNSAERVIAIQHRHFTDMHHEYLAEYNNMDHEGVSRAHKSATWWKC